MLLSLPTAPPAPRSSPTHQLPDQRGPHRKKAPSKCLSFFFKNIVFIYFQREGNRGRRRGRETSMCERNINQLPLTHPQLGTWPTTQTCALTRNRTSDLSVGRPALNPLSHTSQGESVFPQQTAPTGTLIWGPHQIPHPSCTHEGRPAAASFLIRTGPLTSSAQSL